MRITFFAAPALFYRNVTKSFPDLHEVDLVCGNKSDGYSLGRYQLSLGIPGNIVYLWGSSNLFFEAPYDFDQLCCYAVDDKACLASAAHSKVDGGNIIELNIDNLFNTHPHPKANFWNWTHMRPVDSGDQTRFKLPCDYEEDLARVVEQTDRLVN